jgi:hypothetical protein
MSLAGMDSAAVRVSEGLLCPLLLPTVSGGKRNRSCIMLSREHEGNSNLEIGVRETSIRWMYCAFFVLAWAMAAPGSTAGGEPVEPHSQHSARIPAMLAPFGDGFPKSGDVCRKLGESPATSNWLDDSAQLVGCPGSVSALKLGGRIVDVVKGVVMVSIPLEQRSAAPRSVEEMPDRLILSPVIMRLPSFTVRMAHLSSVCARRGVRRADLPAGISLVEVTGMHGKKRVFFFRGTQVIGVELAQAKRTAAVRFKASRTGDTTRIGFGRESYTIPDALIEGG